jgi:quercetin dioxygenase-like cupin family protein
MKVIKPKTSKGPVDWFKGDVYPTIVFAGDEPSRVRMGSVHFTPGAHTAWHSHAVGQYLYVIEGTALVQERGEKIKILKPGEIVYTAPGVEHWHGASADSFMIHIAV